jgi:hypothetical protein
MQCSTHPWQRWRRMSCLRRPERGRLLEKKLEVRRVAPGPEGPLAPACVRHSAKGGRRQARTGPV